MTLCVSNVLRKENATERNCFRNRTRRISRRPFLLCFPMFLTRLRNIGKQSKNAPRGIRRARSRNPQSHCVKCLKVMYFIVLLHSLRRGATNQAKSIGKRNDFTTFRNPSEYVLDDFWNLKWSPGALERDVIFCYLSNGFEVVFFLVHSLAGWRSTRPKKAKEYWKTQLFFTNSKSHQGHILN